MKKSLHALCGPGSTDEPPWPTRAVARRCGPPDGARRGRCSTRIRLSHGTASHLGAAEGGCPVAVAASGGCGPGHFAEIAQLLGVVVVLDWSPARMVEGRGGPGVRAAAGRWCITKPRLCIAGRARNWLHPVLAQAVDGLEGHGFEAYAHRRRRAAAHAVVLFRDAVGVVFGCHRRTSPSCRRRHRPGGHRSARSWRGCRRRLHAQLAVVCSRPRVCHARQGPVWVLEVPIRGLDDAPAPRPHRGPSGSRPHGAAEVGVSEIVHVISPWPSCSAN